MLSQLNVKEKKFYGDFCLQQVYHDFLRKVSIADNPESTSAEIILYNLGKFSQVIDDFETIHFATLPKNELSNFCKFLEYTANGAYPEGHIANTYIRPDAVNIMSVHQSKGLEFTAVFIPQLNKNNFPSKKMGGKGIWHVIDVNWELVTKKGNNALKDSEKANLFERIAEAHKDGTRFVIIIDEEHMNNTAKADDIISAFAAKNIIRVSATANKVEHQEFYEIPEEDVINAGLITRAIYVNEGVNEKEEFENDYDYLLELADDKRKEIRAGYEMVGADIRPLVLIQFPVGQPETIVAVQDKLAEMGYTYDNGMVNIWMSDDKMISNDLTAPNGTPVFLLMKQAISTGWDCPRAKILVKLREGGSQDFQIQTIGRIRRMPERKHYIFPATLDFCYLYTLDTQYKEGLLSSLDKAYQVRRLFAKEEVRDFTLTKEMRNLDIDTGIGERELLKRVYEHLKKKYDLVVVAEVVVVTASVAEDVVCSVLSSISCGVVLLSDSSILVAKLVSDFAFELDTESVLVSSSQPEKRNDADRKIASKDIGLRFIRAPPNCSLYLNYSKVVVSFSGQ